MFHFNKYLYRGQIIIVKDGAYYNIQGQKLNEY